VVVFCDSVTILRFIGHITVLHATMQPIVTDGVAWSVGRSVCRSVTIVNPTKMAEPIEMLFGCGLGWALGTIFYMGIQILPFEGAILRGKGRLIVTFCHELCKNSCTDRHAIWDLDLWSQGSMY